MTDRKPLGVGVPLDELSTLVGVLTEIQVALTGHYKLDNGSLYLETGSGYSIEALWARDEWQITIRPTGQERT